MKNQSLKIFKKVLYEAAEEAGKIITKHYKTAFLIGRKQHYSDLVTEIDKKSEKKIIDVIHNHFPGHNILSEECGDLNMKSDYVWIIDPIDGTVNYAHSLPIFCVSIALEIKKKVKIGLIYNPMNNEYFYGENNKGAYLNGKRIRVSGIKYLKDALLVTGFPYGAQNNTDHCINHFVNFIKAGLPIRRLGSAALDLCYVACGRIDGFWEVSLNPWDVAAGNLILKEAGGKVTNFFGKKYSIYNKQILATNGKIHREMIEILDMVNN
jgi:myo-inositol-1(or 4)-monophosphatase